VNYTIIMQYPDREICNKFEGDFISPIILLPIIHL
jgi:hypothetical protein